MTTMELAKNRPETAKPAAGYVRIAAAGSDVAQQVEAQKLVIERLAERSGLRVTQWYVDVGKSGLSLERPALNEMLAEAGSGNVGFERVLVCGMDRLSRKTVDLAVILDLLADAGVELVSAT